MNDLLFATEALDIGIYHRQAWDFRSYKQMASFTALSAIGSNAVESITRHMSRVKVDIVLHDQPSGIVASYTTRDRIAGEVTVTTEQDTKFDFVEITFEGESSSAR